MKADRIRTAGGADRDLGDRPEQAQPVGPGGDDSAWFDSGAYLKGRPVTFSGRVRTSRYLMMRDGIRIAVDVHLPKRLGNAKLPTVVRSTCYSRALEFRFPFNLLLHGGPLDGLYRKTRHFILGRGYAWIDVDARGSGASFGWRPCPWSPDEVADGAEIVDWIVSQPWSNGRVGAVGNSYDGTAAEFLAITGHPAVKAVVPRYSLFDAFADIGFPGGVHQTWVTEVWEQLNRAMQLDRFHDAVELSARMFVKAIRTRAADEKRSVLGLIGQILDREPLYRLLSSCAKAITRGVRPVDSDQGRVLAKQAIAEHTSNDDIHAGALRTMCRDDTDVAPSDPEMTVDAFSPHTHVATLKASPAAVYSYSGWFDGAYPNSAIKRHLALARPGDRLMIGPWDHGGWRNVSPFANRKASRFPHDVELLRFFDHHLNGLDNEIGDEFPIHFFTMGEERWKATTVWPPVEVETISYYLAPDGRLDESRPDSVHGTDEYRVDPATGTGGNSRWRAQMGVAGRYPDRARRDAKLHTYTSHVLESALEVTGHPVLRLFLCSSAGDGAVFAYLEDVDAADCVSYVTEGQLRLAHRALSRDVRPDAAGQTPMHSFRKVDTTPMVANETAEVIFDLLPTSYRFDAGHRIRLALAGADCDHFDLIGAEQQPLLQIERSATYHSRVELPIARASSIH